MNKIVSIIGARPNFIKAAALSNRLKTSKLEEVIIHTGQHFSPNMSESFFNELDIPKPDYNLDIHSLSHGAMTGRMVEKIEEVLLDVTPNVVVVHGDTNSTLAGALAAVKLHIPVAHIEAGVRSFNMTMPEEVNRILTDHISKMRFCTSFESIRNLEGEGLTRDNIISGDLMYDIFLQYKDVAKNRKYIFDIVKEKSYGLVTIHREENTQDITRLYNILNAMSSCPYMFVFPVHPRTEKIMRDQSDAFKNIEKKGNIIFIKPTSYIDMICLELNSTFIMTDSGGVQKEAYYAHVPCLILRDETEWVELVQEGYTTLVGAQDTNQIIKGFNSVMLSNIKFTDGIYGSGNAAETIVDKLEYYWG